MKIATAPEKSYPTLSQQSPSKNWGLVKPPPLSENLVGGSTPAPAERGERGCHYGDWRKLCKLTIKLASSKTVFKDSANTSCALSTGCFFWLYIHCHWMTLQKMNISKYVCKTYVKELAMKTGNPPKKYCSLSKFCSYLPVIF